MAFLACKDLQDIKSLHRRGDRKYVMSGRDRKD